MHIKSIIKKRLNLFHSRYADTIYNIGIIPHSDEILSAKEMPTIKWIKHQYDDRWFADPFIVSEDEKTYTIFVETYYYDVRKGSLGMIIADKKDFRLVEYKDILVLSTHLSFPCYYYENDILYVYPENSRSGCNTLFHFDFEKKELVKDRVLCEDPLTDAVVMTSDHKWLTATYSRDCNGANCHVYCYDDISRKYIHKHDIHFSDNTARGAGLPFITKDGRHIRPAQDCNGGYGVGLVFQEIGFDGDKLMLKELNRIKPNDKKYNIGLHTYNRFGSVAIVDGYYGPTKWGKWVFNQIKKMM